MAATSIETALREELMYECVLFDGQDDAIFIELFRKAIDLFPPLPAVIETQSAIGRTVQREWIQRKRALPVVETRRFILDFCVDVLRATTPSF